MLKRFQLHSIIEISIVSDYKRHKRVRAFCGSYVGRDFGSIFDHVSFHDEVIQQTVLVREDEVLSRRNVLWYLLVRIRPANYKYKINQRQKIVYISQVLVSRSRKTLYFRQLFLNKSPIFLVSS